MLIPPKICCSSCARTSPSSLTAVHNSIACATILSINTKEYHPDPLNNLAFYMDLVTKNKDRLAYKEPKSLEHTARTTCLISLSTFFNKGRGYLVEKGWMVQDRFYARNKDHPLSLSNQAELGWKKDEIVTPLVGIKIHFDLMGSVAWRNTFSGKDYTCHLLPAVPHGIIGIEQETIQLKSKTYKK